MKFKIYIYLFTIFFLYSCGEKLDEIKQTAENIQNLSQNADKINESINRSEERLKQRIAKGDTLPLHFNELAKFLPETIDEYKGSEIDGNTTNAIGFSISQVSRTYSNSNTNTYFKISLIDYNASYQYLSGLAYWTNLNLSSENNDGYEKTIKTNIEDVFAYEKFSKSGKYANIFYVIGYRFYLTIEANYIDNPDILKTISSKIDLQKLAKL